MRLRLASSIRVILCQSFWKNNLYVHKWICCPKYPFGVYSCCPLSTSSPYRSSLNPHFYLMHSSVINDNESCSIHHIIPLSELPVTILSSSSESLHPFCFLLILLPITFTTHHPYLCSLFTVPTAWQPLTTSNPIWIPHFYPIHPITHFCSSHPSSHSPLFTFLDLVLCGYALASWHHYLYRFLWHHSIHATHQCI